MNAQCPFCDIVAGTQRPAVVREDEMTLAFLTIEPVTEGHTLVVPKRHARNLFDINTEDLRAVAVASQEVARRQRDRLGCAGVTTYQANESAGFQTVFHFHTHVVPRYPCDRVLNAWHDLARAPMNQLEEVARRLRGQQQA